MRTALILILLSMSGCCPAMASIVEQSNGYGESINTSSDPQDKAQYEHQQEQERESERVIKLGGGM